MTIAICLAAAAHTMFALVTDVVARRIPNLWNLAAALAGLAVHGAAGGWKGLAASLTGGFVLLVATVPLQFAGAVGGGDVKWFAALGIWTGAGFALQTLLYAILAAGLLAFIHFLAAGTLRTILERWWVAGWLAAAGRSPVMLLQAKRGSERKEMPMMVAVLPAIGLAAWQWWREGGGWW
jgi:prepilin peptidase CpaA